MRSFHGLRSNGILAIYDPIFYSIRFIFFWLPHLVLLHLSFPMPQSKCVCECPYSAVDVIE